MQEDDNLGRSTFEPQQSPPSSLEEQNKFRISHEKKERLRRESLAREFLQSPQASKAVDAHDLDERLRSLTIDAAAKDMAENYSNTLIRPKELTELIEAAVSKAREQERLERERVVAKELQIQREADTQQQARIDQNARNFFERGAQRTERENQKAQPLGKYRKLDELSHRDGSRDAVESREQREQSDRRQSLDPATRAANVANDRGRPPIAGEVKDIWREAKSLTREVQPRENDGPSHDRSGRGGRSR
jgi:hypothetical protein